MKNSYLFDIEKDPYETNDLSNKYANKLQSMVEDWNNWTLDFWLMVLTYISINRIRVGMIVILINMKIYIFDGQRPSLQQQYAVLGLFCKLVSVAVGVDRRKESPTRKTRNWNQPCK